MFSFFKRRVPENLDDITLDFDDPAPVPTDTGSPPVRRPLTAMDAMRNELDPLDENPEETELLLQVCARVVEDLNAEEIRRGTPFAPEERRVLLETTGRKAYEESMAQRNIADLLQGMTSAIQSQTGEVAGRLDKISDKLDEPRDAIGRALKFQKEHPFLAGVIGANMVHSIKKR